MVLQATMYTFITFLIYASLKKPVLFLELRQCLNYFICYQGHIQTLTLKLNKVE